MTGAELYAELSPKQRRVVNADVATLFSPGGFMPRMTIDEVKRLGSWHPTVKYKGGTYFLSDRGIAALRRLETTVSRVTVLALVVSKHEISSEVVATHARFIGREVEPTGQEFFIEAADSLVASVKAFEFLALIDGLDLKDVPAVELGSTRIQRPDRQLFEKINFEGNLDLDSVYKHFEDSLWLVATVTGSPDIAAERFRYRATLTVGLLAILGVLQYRGVIWKTRVRAITPSRDNRKVITLRWEPKGANPLVSVNWGEDRTLPVTAESLAYVTRECFFRQLSALPDRENRDEIQDAIITSVYWFADAYSDRNPTMQFVKLWSCMECFFSIEKEGVTDLNAKGMAALLTFAGYSVTTPAEYPRLKARLKKLYDLRSEAVHRGRVGHIETEDLETFSRWVAWVIVSMMSLSERGYQTLRRVLEEASRLDAGPT